MFGFKDYSLKIGEYYKANLSIIYGIGLERASYISSLLGISQSLSTRFMNYYYFESSSAYIRLNFITDERLQAIILELLKILLMLRIRRGIRFFNNLPNRGQRTHANSKQKKYLKQNEI